MTTFIATLCVFLTAVVGLGVGVIISNRRLKGTCGGLGTMKDSDGESICDACTTPSEECRELRKERMRSESESPIST